MKIKHLKKIIVLSFVLSLFLVFTMPKVFATDTNINTNSYRIHREYNTRNSVQARHVTNNSSGKKDPQITTWIGVGLLTILFLAAIKTLPTEIEKRL